MQVENKVKIQFTEEEKQTLTTGLNQVGGILKAKMISLSPERKKSMLTMGDKSLSFVSKCLMFANQNPDFIPNYLDKEEWTIDLQAWNELNPYYARIQELNSLLNDTIALCGNEAFRQALTFYNSVKQASKDNIPGAKVIYEELKQQFPNHKKNKNNAE